MNTRRSFMLLALAAPCCLAGGCRPRAAAPPVRVVLGFDASRSYRDSLPDAVHVAARLTARLEPGSDAITLFRVDEQAREFLDSPAPASSEGVQQTLNAELAKTPAHDGTRPAAFYRAAADAADRCPTPAVIALCSDGDMTPASDAAIRAAARRLAANPRVVVVAVCGARPENRALLRDQFAPLGGKLVLYAPEELNQTMLDGLLHAANR